MEGVRDRTVSGRHPGGILNGLVLSGGESRRMGQPKCLLPYGGIPAWRRAVSLLQPFCDTVYIACKPDQTAWFEDSPVVTDQPVYGEIGPLNGLLSAYDLAPHAAWLLLGCDYPLLQADDLQFLLEHRNLRLPATVLMNPESGFIEPLVGIYEAAAGPLLRQWLAEGNTSLRLFHREAVAAPAPERLRSIDTPEDYRTILPAGQPV